MVLILNHSGAKDDRQGPQELTTASRDELSEVLHERRPMIEVGPHRLAEPDAKHLEQAAAHWTREIGVRLDAVDQDDALSCLCQSVNEQRHAIHFADLNDLHGRADRSAHSLRSARPWRSFRSA